METYMEVFIRKFSEKDPEETTLGELKEAIFGDLYYEIYPNDLLFQNITDLSTMRSFMTEFSYLNVYKNIINTMINIRNAYKDNNHEDHVRDYIDNLSNKSFVGQYFCKIYHDRYDDPDEYTRSNMDYSFNISPLDVMFCLFDNIHDILSNIDADMQEKITSVDTIYLEDIFEYMELIKDVLGTKTYNIYRFLHTAFLLIQEMNPILIGIFGSMNTDERSIMQSINSNDFFKNPRFIKSHFSDIKFRSYEEYIGFISSYIMNDEKDIEDIADMISEKLEYKPNNKFFDKIEDYNWNFTDEFGDEYVKFTSIFNDEEDEEDINEE